MTGGFIVPSKRGPNGVTFGRLAIERLIEYVKTWPYASVLLTSLIEGEGTPKGYYESLGFHPIGECEEGKTIMNLDLESLS